MTRFGRSSPRSARSASSVSEAEQILARQAAQRKQSVYKGPMRKGSALEAALAKKFKESRAMEGDAELLKEKAIHDGECVNRLAFYDLVGNVFEAMRDNTKNGAGGNVAGLSAVPPPVAASGGGVATTTKTQMELDERVALLTSAGIARVICEIVHSIPTKETEDGDFHEVKKMKLEDIYAYMVKHHSDVILTDLDEADEPDALSARRAIRKFAVDAAGNAIGSTADVLDSVGAAGMNVLIGKLVTVAPENVGKRFQVATITLGDGKGTGELWTTAIAAVSDFVQPTMGGNKSSSIIITTDVAGLTKEQAAKAATILLTPIVFHMISYIYVSVIDSMLATYKKSGNLAAFDASGIVFHYNLAYPSIVAVMDMYEVNEEDFDHYVAKMIDSIPAVSKVFKAAKKAYDATATPRGRVYRGKADDTPAYFQTEEEKRRAAEEFESMKYENKKSTAKPVDVSAFTGKSAADIAGLAAQGRLARAELLGTPVAFGRRHKKRGSKKRAASFGKRKSRKARRGSKKRAASFGKRKARRGSKKNSFGKKRRSAGRR